MSGASKFGRGGGRGPSRLVAAPPPLGRGMTAMTRRGGVGMKGKGGKESGVIGKGSSGAAPSQEESFQLISEQLGVRPPFAMAIRLTPGLLDELKRVEAGGVCSMKFGASAGGHVIKVGEEEFKLSSAPEPGDLCDIFEEERRGEDGQGRLVEAGSVWRKLSVIRTLSATEKDRVKKRSVEAERQQKSRKAIILDPNHSLVNNQAASSGDANGRRGALKTKKDPPKKKQKVAISSPAVPVKPKSVAAAAPPPATARPTRAVSISSPEPPPVRAPVMLPPRGRLTGDDSAIAPPPKPSTVVQKDKTPSPAAITAEAGGSAKAGAAVNTIELRNCLITLLTDNPKGMTIKAVEKALGEAMANVRPERKTIEKAIKAIASYHAPGKYMLKEGVKKGSFAKPSPGSGSSPEIAPADSPPLVDSPALTELASDVAPEAGNDTGSGGLLGERPSVPPSDFHRADGTSRSSSISVQRAGETAIGRAIRKAGEMMRGNAERSQPTISERMSSSTATQRQKPEFVSTKQASPHGQESGPDVEQISVGGDESPNKERAEAESGLYMKEKEARTDSGVLLESHAGPLEVGGESAPGSPKVDVKGGNSAGSDSSSSSGSGSESDSDSEASRSGSDSHSDTSHSGSGTESDSDASSSSGSEDENMDEDVDIISEDEEKAAPNTGDALRPKTKAKDAKTQLQRQDSKAQKQASKQAKRARSKVPEKVLIPLNPEEVDIGSMVEGCEATVPKCTDEVEKMGEGVETLDTNADAEVDVISCDGDVGSPNQSGLRSPAVSSRKQSEGSTEEVEGSEGQKLETTCDNKEDVGARDKSGSGSDQSIGLYRTKTENSGAHGITTRTDDCDSLQGTTGKPNSESLSPEGLVKGGEPNHLERDTNLGKAKESEKVKPPAWRGRRTNDRSTSKETHVHGASPSIADITSRSLLGSPAVKKVGNESGPLPGKDTGAKGRAMSDVRKSFAKDAGVAVKTAEDIEMGEYEQKTIEVSTKPLQGSTWMGDSSSRVSKQVEPPPLPCIETETLSRNSEGKPKGLREGAQPAVVGRDLGHSNTEPFARPSREMEPFARPPRDMNLHWRNNPDAGLLGRPDVDFLGRPTNKELDLTNVYASKDTGFLGRPSRDSKQVRRPTRDPEPLRRSEPAKETDTSGKSGKDVDMAARFVNEGEPPNSRLREGRKTEPNRLGKGLLKIDSNDSGLFKRNEDEGRGGSDLELGEWRESTPGEEHGDERVIDVTRSELVKGREATDGGASNRSLGTKGQVSPLKDKVRNKSAGDLRKPSPVTADARKPVAIVIKEVQRVDQGATRDTSRSATGCGKASGIVSQEERMETGPSRSVETIKSRPDVSDLNERPQDSRGTKRPAEDSDVLDTSRVYKRPSAMVPLPASLGRGHPDSNPAKVLVGPELSGNLLSAEVGRASPLDGHSNLAGPSSKAPNVENGCKQRPHGKGQEAPERDCFERHTGQGFDRKEKTSAGLLGPGEKRKSITAPEPGQSNGKRAKLSQVADDVEGMDFFSRYEKKEPELRGPVQSYDQSLEYRKEYREKYEVYLRLHTAFQEDKVGFEAHLRDLNQTKDNSMRQHIFNKVSRNFHGGRKRSKRMHKTFDVLHDELHTIKQRLTDFAEKVGQG